MNIKKGDNVKVLVGKDKGKTGKVYKAFPKTNSVLIEGLNLKKRHQKSRKQGGKGQVIDLPAPIHASNVAKA
jgi:large subunit ribosomal protein L24